MTVEISNALFGYFEALYDLNRNLIMLCGVDVIDNEGQYEKRVREIVQNIPRLVPYAFSHQEQKYVLDDHAGLLEFCDELRFLKSGYMQIFTQNYSFLEDIKTVRNQFEHKMHGVRLVGSDSGSGLLFSVTYELKRKSEITLTANAFMQLAKSLNELFSEIQDVVSAFAHKQEKADYTYYRRLLRYRFSDFNKIYENDQLRNFGKALFPF